MFDRRRLFLSIALGLAACTSEPTSTSNTNSAISARPQTLVERRQQLLAMAGGVASSIETDGSVRFVTALGYQPGDKDASRAAREHLARFAPALDLPLAALESAEVVRVQDLGSRGTIVILRQYVDGLEVYRSEIKVLLRQDHSLVAFSGTPSAIATPYTNPDALAFTLDAGDALGIALSAEFQASVKGIILKANDGDSAATAEQLGVSASSPVQLDGPARGWKIVVPSEGSLVAAYFVELFARGGAWRYVIAADDGRVLERRDLTADDTYNYRVWADPNGDKRPLDGPAADFAPHPTGFPDGSNPTFIAPKLISIDSFNATLDPWLPTGATNLFGNNVQAYTDANTPDGFSAGDLQATNTSANTFDRVYNVTLSPTANATQSMASITQLFYTTNWLHDWYYDSGFDEAAGNAQLSNLGRGGAEADPLLAEAQDGSGTDNANMATPADGLSPRMQMFLWSAPSIGDLIINGAPFNNSGAQFGPQVFDVTAGAILAVDGAAPTGDACTALVNNVSGKIAIIDRGVCTFTQKVKAAQVAGAVGVIIANNVSGVFEMGGTDNTINIPSMMVSLEDSVTIKNALQSGAVTARLHRTAGVQRDGSLDGTIVAHEWGHYLHHRLADCGTAAQCNAMSEGWGDFVASAMAVREGDNLDGTFAVGIYATKVFGDSGYFGVRRIPYSVDFTKNAFTFIHIVRGQPLPVGPPVLDFGDNAEVHNAGEIWATMMFEGYVSLLKTATGATPTRSFDEARRAMSDYVVAGLQLTPPDATYTEQRDAILAAAGAKSQADAILLAEAFARRGSGTCAVSPARTSTDFAGVVESFAVAPKISIGAISIDESQSSCDFAGELHIPVQNGGAATMQNTTVQISTTTTGVTFTNGSSQVLSSISPFSTQDAIFGIALDPTLPAGTVVNISITATNAASCVTTATATFSRRTNVVFTPNASATDDVEADQSTWTPTGSAATDVWKRVALSASAHEWQGADLDHLTDTSLESPTLQAGAGPLTVTLQHSWKFERAQGKNFDGGVIEVSVNGGAFVDVSTFANPGYNGAITTSSDNPLGGRQAFTNQNPAFPAKNTTTLSFGTQLANQSFTLRFRIGTDSGVGNTGWAIDNIAFQGITNTPFGTITVNSCSSVRACNDNIDNDGDGLVDFPNDPGCSGAFDSDELNTFACNDGIDNDADGLTDFPNDPGCANANDNNESNLFACNDGADNDGDGFTDFPNDPGCTSTTDDNESNLFACNDGVDNDGDGLSDFPNDPGCTSATDNDEFNLFACNDGVDNDGDGFTDFPNDPGCVSATDNDESNLFACNDGVDNDSDGFTDFPNDPGCASATDNNEFNLFACNDGADNDGDGLTDFPNDPGCVSVNDNDESNLFACNDGIDNDNDGLADFPNDPGCASATDNDETNAAAACADGLDNDNDGLTDFPNDPGCASINDNDESNLFACNDGVDNDGDGLADFPNDPGCSSASDNDEFNLFACNDGIDNDGDGLADFPNDPGCASATDNNEANAAAACSDGADNDGDGLADFPNDPGCTDANDNDEFNLFACNDNIDNDGDGFTDFPNDPGCASATDNDESNLFACNDGIDNDGDGFVDSPNDPGCSSATDNDESNLFACNDGIDNDGDGLSDFPNDPGCANATDNDESNLFACNDGADNDGDGLTDFPNDPGCASASDNDETNAAAACADGADNDGDGLVDFPNDPGCASASDDNETNLFACNDGIDNDGDGLEDFPNDPGCASATDNDEQDAPTFACSDGIDNDGDGRVDFPEDPGCTDSSDEDESDVPTVEYEGGSCAVSPESSSPWMMLALVGLMLRRRRSRTVII